MNELAANTLGFYYTEEKTEDGSIIAYRHDRPNLSESKSSIRQVLKGSFYLWMVDKHGKRGLIVMEMPF